MEAPDVAAEAAGAGASAPLAIAIARDADRDDPPLPPPPPDPGLWLRVAQHAVVRIWAAPSGSRAPEPEPSLGRTLRFAWAATWLSTSGAGRRSLREFWGRLGLPGVATEAAERRLQWRDGHQC
eukprot:2794532-Alexandrium_andersonii.AAC.1